MAGDLTTELRRAALTQLRNDPALTAIIPKASIYNGSAPLTPAWPFILWGATIAAPFEATCLAGEDTRCTVHAFVGPRKNAAGGTLETGEDQVGRVAVALKNALHRRTLSIPSGTATLRQISVNRLRDGQAADEWHLVADFRAKIVA